MSHRTQAADSQIQPKEAAPQTRKFFLKEYIYSLQQLRMFQGDDEGKQG